MKAAFMENGVKTARYKQIFSLEQAQDALKELKLPLIVKATDLQGSRGINIVYSEDELVEGYNRTMSETKKDFCIIEEFIEGYDFGAQAFVINNEVLFVLPCGNITYLGNTNIPIGHYFPLEMDEEMAVEVEFQVKAAIKALKLNNCAVNVDMILKNGEVYIIELTGRVGANCLPQLISIYYGIDIYKLIVETAMGKDPSGYFKEAKKAPTVCYAKMLISEKNGILREIINTNSTDENVEEITFFVENGDVIHKFNNSKDCIGQVVVKGENLKACEKLIDKVIDHISFEME